MEIARQLRLRDLGGLIVIDFIDMVNNSNQKLIEQKLRESMSMDRAKIQMAKLSRFGLLEMSRQRLCPTLKESNEIICPRCKGGGTIPNIESLVLTILRDIESEAIKATTVQVQVNIPIDVGTYIINEKRLSILNIEKLHEVSIILLPSKHLIAPDYKINRAKDSELIDNSSNEK